MNWSGGDGVHDEVLKGFRDGEFREEEVFRWEAAS